MVGRKKRSHSVGRVLLINRWWFQPRAWKWLNIWIIIPEVGNTVSEGMELDCRVLYCCFSSLTWFVRIVSTNNKKHQTHKEKQGFDNGVCQVGRNYNSPSHVNQMQDWEKHISVPPFFILPRCHLQSQHYEPQRWPCLLPLRHNKPFHSDFEVSSVVKLEVVWHVDKGPNTKAETTPTKLQAASCFVVCWDEHDTSSG